jgi:hypothetical protein
MTSSTKVSHSEILKESTTGATIKGKKICFKMRSRIDGRIFSGLKEEYNSVLVMKQYKPNLSNFRWFC